MYIGQHFFRNSNQTPASVFWNILLMISFLTYMYIGKVLDMLFLKVSAENRSDCQQSYTRLQRLVVHIISKTNCIRHSECMNGYIRYTLNQNCSRSKGE